MAHFTNSDVTSGPSKAIHAGVNVIYPSYTLNETASGSTTIAMAKLPAGSRVIECFATTNLTDALGTGGESISVYATIGGSSVATYIDTSDVTNAVRMTNFTGAGFLLTSSANLVMALHDVVNTGSASVQLKVVCSYLSEDDPG
jgi:hypothetical protein